jgi:hypothetical protein
LCYEYKNAISLEEVNAWYAIFHYWKYSLGAAYEVGLQELENLFEFWHFHEKQWGGFMIHVLFSTFPHIFSFIPPFWQVHIYAISHFKIAQQFFFFFL